MKLVCVGSLRDWENVIWDRDPIPKVISSCQNLHDSTPIWARHISKAGPGVDVLFVS